MPWPVKVLLLFAVAFSIGLLGQAIKNILARKTIANWGGSGVNHDLRPEEAALLLGRHPGVLVSLLIHRLERAGKAAVVSLDPVRVEWRGEAPASAVEEAFSLSLDPEGGFREEGVFALLEAMYDRVNEAMLPFSGRGTAVHYRRLVRRFWAETTMRGKWVTETFPWLLIRDPRLVWDEIGDSPEEERLKALYFLQGRLEHRMVPAESLRQAARRAKEGFFAYPRDIIRTEFKSPELERPRWRGARW
ncbi:MAG: hypothetical protein ACYTDY_18660 [Planctomycetota bacterium]|jgi:hypothetical protein